MRELDAAQIVQTVKRLCIEANCQLPGDIKTCIENDDEFIVNSSLEMSDYIISDRSVTQLQELIKKAQKKRKSS